MVQELAALQDFDWAYVGLGSKREVPSSGLMSACTGCGHERHSNPFSSPPTDYPSAPVPSLFSVHGTFLCIAWVVS